MKKIILIFMFFFPAAIYSSYWDDQGIIKIKSSAAESGNSPVSVMKTKGGHTFEISDIESFDDKKSAIVLSMMDRFSKLKFTTIITIRFSSYNDVVYATINASAIEYEKQDINIYIPGGLMFYISENEMWYKFRVISGEISFMMHGKFSDEETLIKKILSDISDIKLQKARVDENGNLKYVETRKSDIQVIHEKEKVAGHEYSPSLQAYIGSGALITMALPIRWKKFEFSTSLGFMYIKKNEIIREAVPAGMRVSWAPLIFWKMEPYIFTGGLYYIGIKNYEGRFMSITGIGSSFLTYFFAEIGYMINKSGGAPTIGLGARIAL